MTQTEIPVCESIMIHAGANGVYEAEFFEAYGNYVLELFGTRVLPLPYSKPMTSDSILRIMRGSLSDQSTDWNEEKWHRQAAYALRDKMGWDGELITGGVKGAYVHVFLPKAGRP